MVVFQELRITPEGDNLIIDVNVSDKDYYNDITIDSVVIDTQDTYIQNGPSSSPLFTLNIDSNNTFLVKKVDILTGKHVRLVLNKTDLNIPNLDDCIFFVYIITKGNPAPDTPCGFDNSVSMGTVLNLLPYYRKVMYYIKELNVCCHIPKHFTDFILRFKALELSIKTGNYILAIKYWNKWFKGAKLSSPEQIKCNCL